MLLTPNIERSMLSLKRRSWTIDEYHAMIDAGILTSEDKVELLFGQIVEMSPVGNAHAVCVKQITRALYGRFLDSEDHVIGVQDPISLFGDTEPEPDIYVASGPLERYHSYHPGAEHLLLVIEVSDSTLQRDKTTKLSAYALAGIEEYWIVDIYNRVVMQCLEPDTDRGIYGKVHSLTHKDEITSLHLGKFSAQEIILQYR